MYKILNKIQLTPDTYWFEIFAPHIAKSALPGQFLIIKTDEEAERIPLTIVDYDKSKGSVVIIFKVVGYSTEKMSQFSQGEVFMDVVGPLGKPSEFVYLPIEEIKKKKFVFVGGGIGIAPIFPQIKWMHTHGIQVDVIIGARTASMLILQKELEILAGNLYVTTDDDSTSQQGLVTDVLRHLIEKEGEKYDEVIAIGPLVMMKYVVETAKEFDIKTIVSMNSLMVDGTGMCGACRVTVGGKTQFTCVDGPEFDGALVDFDEAMKRQAMYNNIEEKKQLEAEEEAEGHICHIGGVIDEELYKKKRVPVREQCPSQRSKNFKEVCLGYSMEEAIVEAQRCIQCKNPLCVKGCPVSIHIPGFIKKIAEGNFEESARIIFNDTALPAICGRVCPQETQCEGNCVLGKKGDAVAIGKLERFIGDWARKNNFAFTVSEEKKKEKIAVVGSGPAGLTCARELAMMGYQVTVFEALNEYGGVLVYGIPSFRLPKEIVKNEIKNIEQMGVRFMKDTIIGRTFTIDELLEKEKFDAVFVGTGAGLPNFMNIEGENLCGVVSANEFLTRNNLLFSYKKGYDTPNYVGKKVAVVGGGNVAIDAARTALRLGSEVHIVYRRSEEELPARAEEVHHAKEEGIQFNLLCNPIEILGDENAWVKAIKCIRMQLGEPDASGRRRPIEIENSEFLIDVDMVIMSIGTSPNPLIKETTPEIETNKWQCIIADEETGQTTKEGVFAGGDAVSGAATVILAMGAGKKAAKAIDRYIQEKK